MTDRPSITPWLTAHLATWLGEWPAPVPLHVVASTRRVWPGWDGRTHPSIGIADPESGAVLSVPPSAAARVGDLAALTDRAGVLAQLPALLGLPRRRTYEAVFRWTTDPARLPEVGEWVPPDQDGVPAWLRPFGGQVLVASDPNGRHGAGVGIKRHDDHGHELSVVTSPTARGQGLARALVAQAARRVLDEGAVPTYLHAVSNTASARVAEAAGFPDHGWTSFGIGEAPAGAPAPTTTLRSEPVDADLRVDVAARARTSHLEGSAS